MNDEPNANIHYAQKINELAQLVNEHERELAKIRRLHDDMQESKWFRLWFRAYIRVLPRERRLVRPMDLPPVVPLTVSETTNRVVTAARMPKRGTSS